MIKSVLPRPMPKCEPTNAMYIEEYKIDKFVEPELSKNLTFMR